MKPSNKKRRKRPDGAKKTFQEKLVSDADCKVLLERRCPICKRCCMSGMLQKERFRAFMRFRRLWADMHKLDQDRYVPSLLDYVFWGFFMPSCFFQISLFFNRPYYGVIWVGNLRLRLARKKDPHGVFLVFQKKILYFRGSFSDQPKWKFSNLGWEKTFETTSRTKTRNAFTPRSLIK